MKISLGLPLICLLAACTSGSSDTPDDAASAGFVTLLGSDTLAVEQFERTATGMNARVVLRAPKTSIRDYAITFDQDGKLALYSAKIMDAAGTVIRTDGFTLDGDSLGWTTMSDGETNTRAIAGHGDMLPFVDMVHWPFELALTRAVASGADAVEQDMFTGRRPLPFKIRKGQGGNMELQHPSRGTMDVMVDESGHLTSLDAGNTTRKLKVARVASVDVDAVAASFAAQDAMGKSFGDLSTRGTFEGVVGGAKITIDHGVPFKRGREIWGSLVKYDVRWRTGANRATHFSTTGDLQVGDIAVPAGDYTLYTIPAADGGTLMINKQTGQTGTRYDESQDLGRTAMTMQPMDNEVEAFTIKVEDGHLRLQWDRSELVVPVSER